MRKVPNRWCYSKFINPFVIGEFIYNNTVYDCSDEVVQTKMFFWMYIFGNRKICSLFEINTPTEGLIELPWRKLSKLMYRIHQTGGWIIYNEYTLLMQKMYLDALRDNMILPYMDDRVIFNRGTQTTWDSWAKTWLLKTYPHIISNLHRVYPDIKLFYKKS